MNRGLSLYVDAISWGAIVVNASASIEGQASKKVKSAG